jgi:hypothetical protein
MPLALFSLRLNYAHPCRRKVATPKRADQGPADYRRSGKSIRALADVCQRERGKEGRLIVESVLRDLGACMGTRRACETVGVPRASWFRHQQPSQASQTRQAHFSAGADPKRAARRS